MKQILTMLQLDARLILRDKIIWYVLVFPAMIGTILILVSGRIGDNMPPLAISPDFPQTAFSAPKRAENLDIQTDRDSFLQHLNTNTSKNFIVQLTMAALFLAPALVGGTVSGFLIVEEKENKLIWSYQIAPIRFSSYISARSLLASIIGMISMTTLCFIFGTVNRLGTLMFILLCSLPLFGVITILFGSLAKDKISCIAMFKILVIIFLVVPLSSAFVPARFHGIFYLLPMYWQFQSVLSVLNGSLNLYYCGITALSATLLFIFTALTCHNKIHKI